MADSIRDPVHGPTVDPDLLLAPVSYERARVLAPFVLYGVVAGLALSDSSGIPLTLPAIIWNVLMIPPLAALTIALWKRRVPVRLGHVAMTTLWWVGVLGTVCSLYFSGHAARLQPLMFVEVCMVAVLLQPRAVYVSLAIFDVLWTPIIFIELNGDTLYFSGMFLAQVGAILLHQLQRKALLRAEAAAAELARQLDERQHLQEQLAHAQRMEAIGTLSAGLAHDMNNVLGSITNVAELLREGASELSRPDLDAILKQSARGAELTRGLLAFSRKGQYRKRVLELDRVIRDVIPLLSRTLPKTVNIRAELAAAGARVDGDAAQLQQLLVNLGVNAADAMSGTGVLAIASEHVTLDADAARRVSLEPGSYVRLRVTDTGVGMDESTVKRAFEPFFTTKPLGKGTGLGLASVWGIVQSHGGAVDIDTQLGRGTTFSIYVPTTAACEVAEPAPAPAPDVKRTMVLVADDEPAVRASTIRLLQRRGLDAIGAADGMEALRMFQEHERAIGLVILDMGMPHMGGSQCYHELRKTSQVPVLIASGFAVDADIHTMMASGAAFIEKPYPAADLLREVTRLLSAS